MAYGTVPEFPTLPPAGAPPATGYMNPFMLMALADAAQGMLGGGAQTPGNQTGAMRQTRPGLIPLDELVRLNVPAGSGTAVSPSPPGLGSSLASTLKGPIMPNMLGTISAALAGPNTWQARLGEAIAKMAQGQQMEAALRAGKTENTIDPLTLYLLKGGR